MDDLIIDTSALVKLVIPEDDSDIVDALFAESTLIGRTIWFPDYYLVESANAIWTQKRRSLFREEEARKAYVKLRNIRVSMIPVLPLLEAAFELALEYDIAVYDAQFVAACVSMKCKGVTADDKLMNKIETAFPQILRLKDWK